MITGNYPNLRLRRSRKNDWSRRLIEENSLSASDFILPIFLIDGKNTKQSIKTMKLNNPNIIPRNHLVEEALTQASENENMIPFNKLLTKLKSPFEHYTSDKYQQPPSSENGYQTFCGT